MKRRTLITAIAVAVLAVFVGNAVYSSLNDGSTLQPTDVLRKVDLVASVTSFSPEVTTNGWPQDNSQTVQVSLDDLRTLSIFPGTLEDDYDAVKRCTDFTTPNACVLLADMLGEAVVWFAIVPADTANGAEFLTLPGLIDMQANGDEGILRNGWVLRLATPVKRQCENADTPHLRAFITQFPDNKSTSLVNLKTDNVVSVSCVTN